VHVDKPVIETATVTGGYRYISVTWTAINYGIVDFNVLLSSPVAMDMMIATLNNSYNFTGLPGYTRYDVTLFGTNVCGVSNVYSTSVNTGSTYICMRMTVCVVY